MPSINRRDFIRGSAALAGAALIPAARAQQLRKINFITPFGFLIGYAPTLNAQAGGHFAKEAVSYTHLTLPTICSV